MVLLVFMLDQSYSTTVTTNAISLTTKHTRVSNTVMFYPHCCKLPLSTPIDQLTMAIQDLTTTLNDPITPMLSVRPNHAIHVIKRIVPRRFHKNRVVQPTSPLTENRPPPKLLNHQTAPCVTVTNKPHPANAPKPRIQQWDNHSKEIQ